MTRPILFTLLFALACGGGDSPDDATEIGTSGGEVEAPPPPPLDPIALLPVDSLAVVTVDVGRLRASPYYSTLHGWLALIEELSPTQREAVDTALASTSLAHISMVDRPCAAKCWQLGSVFLESSLEQSAANATLQQLAQDESFAPREVGGHPAFGDGQGALVHVEPGKYLLGPHRYLEGPLAQPQRPRHEANAAVAAAWQALTPGDATVRGWVVGDATTQALLARETPFSSQVTSLIQGAAFRGDLANGLLIEAVASTNAPAEANTLAQSLRREIDSLTGGLAGRAMGISIIGESTQIAVRANRVHVTLQLADQEFQPLLRRADGLLRLVN